MPLFNVEWKWETEWTVEAVSAAEAKAAAELLDRFEVDPHGPDIWVSGPQKKGARARAPDAVVIDGEMLHPDDAMKARMRHACEMIDDHMNTMLCRHCEHEGYTEYFIDKKDSEIVGFTCPECKHSWDFGELKCLVWREYQAHDFDARQGRLFE